MTAEGRSARQTWTLALLVVLAGAYPASASATITLADTAGTAPATLAPGATSQAIGFFSLRSNTNGDSITGLTVRLGGTTGVASVEIYDATNAASRGTVLNPSGTDVTFTFTQSTPRNSTINFQIRVSTLAHADMPAVPGAEYTTSAYVLSVAVPGGVTTSGSDTTDGDSVIDNLSPSDVTWGAVTPSDGQIALDWTNPGGDFSRVLIVRDTGGITWRPSEGQTPPAGIIAGTLTSVYVGTAATYTDTTVTNGTAYHYKAFPQDTSGNYAVGLETGPHRYTAVTAVAISPTSAAVTVNGTQQFTATVSPVNATDPSVTWSVLGGAACGSVSSSGLYTAPASVAAGCSVRVTTVDGGLTADAPITLQAGIVPVTGVTISPTSATIDVNATQQFTATVSPSNATDPSVSWSVVGASCGSVNATGLYTAPSAVATGCSVRVTTVDGGFTAAASLTLVSGAVGTSVGDASSPPSGTVAPGAAARALDAFTLQTTAGTDAVTSATVTLSAGSWVGLSAVSIQSTSACNVAPYGSAAPSSSTVAIPLAGVTATTTLTTYYVCITPKAHSAMPLPPGAEYAVTGTVTAIASTNAKTYADATSATITIDNRSPANVTWGAITPASGQVTLAWTNPADADFADVVVLRSASAPVVDAPAEGVTYAVGTALANSRVVCAQATSPCTDSGLTNGTPYYYEAFARDSRGNYAVGVAAGPAYPGTNPLPVGSSDPNRPVASILNPSKGSVVSGTFRVQVRAWSPALAILGVEIGYDGANFTALAQSTGYPGSTTSGIWEGQLTLATGPHSLVARARNDASWINSAPVGVVVQPATTGDGRLIVRDNSSQLCSDCHALKAHSSETMGTAHGAWATVCRDCHTPHGTTNISLVPNQITPPPLGAAVPTPKDVSFLSKTGFVDTINPTPTGVCQVCHTRTTFYKADGTGATHQTGSDCSTCHRHADGLRASCTTCHGTEGRVTFAQEAPPADTCGNTTPSGGVGINRVGAHQNHLLGSALSDGIGCSECHVTPPARAGHPGTSCDPAQAQRAVLTWGALATGTVDAWNTSAPAVPSFDYATQTCSSTYCHGNFKNSGVASAVGWHDPVACGDCHQLPPPQPTHSSTSTNCEQCHGTGYAITGITGAALATHVDGRLDVANLTCSSCHGDTARTPVATATDLDANGQNLVKDSPPVDAAGAASGTQVGAHLAHVNQGATAPAYSDALPCTSCHVVPTSTAHSDGTALVTFGGLATARGATPSIDASSNCSSTYCHGSFPTYGNGANPISWGTGTPSKQTCTSCHVNPTAGPTYPHPGNTVSACSTCHGTGYSSTTVAAATHVNGATTQTTFGCSQCHGVLSTPSPGVLASAPTNAAPGAAGTGLATTGAAVSPTTAEYGAHRAHLEQTTYRSGALPCASCHVVPSDGNEAHATGAGTGGARATLTWSALARGTVDAWTTAATPSYTRASGCATVYCHGEFRNGQTGKTVVWAQDTTLTCNSCHGTAGPNPATPPGGTHPANTNCGLCHTGYTGTSVVAATHVDGFLNVAAMTCSGCHGDAARTPVATATALDSQGENLAKASPPVDAAGAASGTQVGAHLAHVNQGATAPAYSNALPCTSCHVVPTSTAHSDGTPLVTFGGLATARGATPTINASNTCSSTYCHGAWTYGNGANAISWGTGTPSKLTCTGCHANSPAHPHPGNQTCADCHTGYSKTGAATGTVAAATHVDGLTTKSSNSCTSCHGDLAQAAGVATITTPTLAAPGANAAATSKDTVGSTATTVNAIGAHRAHLFKTNLRSAALACTQCHAIPPSNTDTTHATDAGTGGARAALTWGTLARGAVDAWSGTVTPAYAGSTSGTGGTTGGTCSNTYCHGNFRNGASAAPSWPGTYSATLTATTLDCNSCHGRGTGATATPPVDPHPNNTSCGTCHTGYTSTTVVAATHIDGRLDGGGGPNCLGCHNAVVGSRRNVQNDFADGTTPNFRSHHVGNGGNPFGGTLTNNDCHVCHAEYDIGSASTGALHMNGLIDLRDADNSANYFQYDSGAVRALGTAGAHSGSATFRQEMSGRTDDAVGAPNYFTGTCPSGSPNCRKGLDRFCISCHDADGASASAAAVGEGAATALNPFNDTSITNMSDQVSRGRVVDIASRVHETARTAAGGNVTAADRDSGYAPAGATVRGADGRNDPPEGVFARHAIRGLSVSVYGTATSSWDTPFCIGGRNPGTACPTGSECDRGTCTQVFVRSKVTWASSSVMACADCHTTDGVNGTNGNAHGANTEYLLKNADGTSASEPAVDAYASYSCAACHNVAYYQPPNTGTHTNNGSDWVDTADQVGANRAGSKGNILGIACGNCHGGGPPNKTGVTFPAGSVGATGFGTIHGTSQVLGIATATGTTRPAYRFTNGNSMRYYDPGTWATTATTRGCYTIGSGDSWGGCTQHGGAGSSDLEPPQKRPLRY